MGLLGDILVGAVGYGLPQTLARVEAREERDAERQRQERAEAKRDAREREMQAERIEAQRTGLLARTRNGTAGGTGSRGGGSADGYARAYTKGREGVSEAEVDAVSRGENPFTRASGEDREGNAIMQADEARFMKVFKSFNQALARGHAGAQADDIAKGEQTELVTDGMRGVLSSGNRGAAGLLGRTVAASRGEGAYRVQDSTMVDQFSGDAAPTEIGRSEIVANKARAAQSNAGATENLAQADKAKRETTGLRDSDTLKSLDGDVSRAEADVRVARTALSKAVGGKQREAAQADLDEAEGRLRNAQAQRDDFRAPRSGQKQGDGAASGDKFVAGKVYKDAKGNRARYLGNGKWQPL